MPWTKLDDGFFAHPKLEAAGLDGTGLFAKAIAYCSLVAYPSTDDALAAAEA